MVSRKAGITALQHLSARLNFIFPTWKAYQGAIEPSPNFPFLVSHFQGLTPPALCNVPEAVPSLQPCNPDPMPSLYLCPV
jgi:hypothetical protein